MVNHKSLNNDIILLANSKNHENKNDFEVENAEVKNEITEKHGSDFDTKISLNNDICQHRMIYLKQD